MSETLTETTWQPGSPPGLSPVVLLIDRQCYGRMQCTTCGRRNNYVRPYHRGREYRIEVICRCCGHTEEI